MSQRPKPTFGDAECSTARSGRMKLPRRPTKRVQKRLRDPTVRSRDYCYDMADCLTVLHLHSDGLNRVLRTEVSSQERSWPASKSRNQSKRARILSNMKFSTGWFDYWCSKRNANCIVILVNIYYILLLFTLLKKINYE